MIFWIFCCSSGEPVPPFSSSAYFERRPASLKVSNASVMRANTFAASRFTSARSGGRRSVCHRLASAK